MSRLCPLLCICLLSTGCISSFLADSLVHPKRQPILENPSAYGMRFEEVSYLSSDGVQLHGWLIGPDSDRLIVMTHPMTFSKYGFAPEYQGMFKVTSLHVEFLKTARVLVDNGYSVLAFDFRNHGDSAEANGGYSAVGLFEWQDVAGTMDFVASRDDLRDDGVGFVSHCMGANSTIVAMSRAPEKFAKARVLVAIQPVLADVFTQLIIQDKWPLFSGFYPGIDREVRKHTGYTLEEMSPRAYLRDLKVPVLYAQIRTDPWTDPSDIQTLYDETPTEKELFWMEGPERFSGYNYFGDQPAVLIAFIKKHMEAVAPGGLGQGSGQGSPTGPEDPTDDPTGP